MKARQEQLDVAQDTLDAHKNGRHTMTQAGTGSGKTVVSVLQASEIAALYPDETVLILVPTRDKVFATYYTAKALGIDAFPYPSSGRIICPWNAPGATSLETACLDSPDCVDPSAIGGHVGRNRACKKECCVKRPFLPGVGIMTQAMFRVLKTHTPLLNGKVKAIIVDEAHSWFKSGFDEEGPALKLPPAAVDSKAREVYLGTNPDPKLVALYTDRLKRRKLSMSDEESDAGLTQEELRDRYVRPGVHWFAEKEADGWRVRTVRYSSPKSLLDDGMTVHMLSATIHDTMRKHFDAIDTRTLTGIPSVNRRTVRVQPAQGQSATSALASTLEVILNDPNGGGTLVLFTSRKAMLDFADQFERLYPHTLVPGELVSAADITRTMQQDAGVSRYVAFGLDGLSEGLDLPGRALTDVVLASHAQISPSNALGMWLHHLYRSGGPDRMVGRPMSEDSQWWTSPTQQDLYRTRLRQSAGRLLRTAQDSGRVWLIVDPAKDKLPQPLLQWLHVEEGATTWTPQF